MDYPKHHAKAVWQVHAQGKPRPWETERTQQIIHAYLRAVKEDSPGDPILGNWLYRFDEDRETAAKEYWVEIKACIDSVMESLANDP